ncbi:hypothetical protein G7B13_29700, partial [Klebsiella pneumoniae]|nr:hypothetical protein [Klebsiella pneumoniae]
STFNSAEEGTTLRPVPACITPTLTREAPALCGDDVLRPLEHVLINGFAFAAGFHF